MNDMELLARYLVQQKTRHVDHQHHLQRYDRGGLRRSARLIAQQIGAGRRHAG